MSMPGVLTVAEASYIEHRRKVRRTAHEKLRVDSRHFRFSRGAGQNVRPRRPLIKQIEVLFAACREEAITVVAYPRKGRSTSQGLHMPSRPGYQLCHGLGYGCAHGAQPVQPQ